MRRYWRVNEYIDWRIEAERAEERQKRLTIIATWYEGREMTEPYGVNPFLATDLYELTMAKGYLDSGMENKKATFDMFVRELPEHWGFILANGIEDAIQFLTEGFFPRPKDLDYLRAQGFPEYFIEFLEGMRFSGDLWAVREGTPMAPNAPLIRVTAPLIQAQMAETALLNLVNFQTLITSKANRIVRAAGVAPVVDFGLRRAHGPWAGLKGARAAFVGGCRGTSNVDAGRVYRIPITGTQAHSWIMAFPSEIEAFRAYAASYRDKVTFLIDTYDVLQGARNAAIVGREMEARGQRLDAVRIDSGDIGKMSREVRDILDRNGLGYVRIVGTSDLDEFKISDLAASGAEIDSYGVGTEMITGRPVAALSGVYKLVQIDDRPVIKLSRDKITYPGIKQAYRLMGSQGEYVEDILALEDEKVADEGIERHLDGSSHEGRTAIPLLRQAVSEGERIIPCEEIHRTQSYAADCISKMPEHALKIRDPVPYALRLSEGLKELLEDLRCGREHL